MSFDPVQILNNLRKKSQAQVSVQPLGNNMNILNQFTSNSSLRRDNSNFDSLQPPNDPGMLQFATEDYASHRSHGSEFTINPPESSSRGRPLTGFENTAFFRTEGDSSNRAIQKKLEFTPRVGPDSEANRYSDPDLASKKENMILLEYAKKFQEVEKRLQDQDSRLMQAYNEIGRLKDEKSELEYRVKTYEETDLDNSHSICLFDATKARLDTHPGNSMTLPSKNQSSTVENILYKRERTFSPMASKNSTMKSFRKPGSLRLEPFLYLNRQYPDFPKSVIKINLSELDVQN